jgi:hypothetical protein
MMVLDDRVREAVKKMYGITFADDLKYIDNFPGKNITSEELDQAWANIEKEYEEDDAKDNSLSNSDT